MNCSILCTHPAKTLTPEAVVLLFIEYRELELNEADGRKAANDTFGKPAANRPIRKPGWTVGLKQLYDSVVDEPLPDSFEDLLKKLDGSKDG